ncbi:MAG: ribonuclease III domain-containing protein [Eubacteriales bacterium]|nr:ribonuclease III domain-containing protein [bacterium]MDY2793508.1 ribonuclease III domain-containing protein [Eubacteriales bacterium]
MDDIMKQGQLPGSLELAYLGDTLWDLFVREELVKTGGRMKELHRAAVARVRASAQSRALARIEDCLTEDEAAVVRRARNAHQTPPKNADPADYCRATALEALFGYLYLTGQLERMKTLMYQAENRE